MAHSGSNNSENYIKELHNGVIHKTTKYAPHEKLLISDRSFQLATTDFLHRQNDIFKNESDMQMIAYENEVDTKLENIIYTRYRADCDKHEEDYKALKDYYDSLVLRQIDLEKYLSEIESLKLFNTTLFDTVGVHLYKVPLGTIRLDVEVVAAQGQNYTTSGGKGGLVSCTLKVSPGQLLYCYVGGVPNGRSTAQYNASDIRTEYDSPTGNTLNNRIVTAGAGGNGATTNGSATSAGANGGYPNGNTAPTAANRKGTAIGGGGATQSAGGSAGIGGGDHIHYGYNSGRGYPGVFGLGGNASYGILHGGAGGAGGAGWYGGGGGGYGDDEHNDNHYRAQSGGGGGSSYAHPDYCTNIVYRGGVRSGNGYIKLTEL